MPQQAPLPSVLVNGETLYPHIAMAKWLGYERHSSLAMLIDRNRAELGEVASRRRLVDTGMGARVEVTEYLLTEAQLLTVGAHTRTPRGAALRSIIINTIVGTFRAADIDPFRLLGVLAATSYSEKYDA